MSRITRSQDGAAVEPDNSSGSDEEDEEEAGRVGATEETIYKEKLLFKQRFKRQVRDKAHIMS